MKSGFKTKTCFRIKLTKLHSGLSPMTLLFFFFLEIKVILIFSLPKMSLSLVPKAMWTTRASTEAWSRGQRIMQWCNLLEKHGEVRISSIKANTEIRNRTKTIAKTLRQAGG